MSNSYLQSGQTYCSHQDLQTHNIT